MTDVETSPYRVAVVQRPPIALDRAATINRAVAALHEAADTGAGLIVFPETYVPGYPEYIWRLRPADDSALAEELHARLLAAAVDLGAGDLSSIREAARERDVVVVTGIHERDGAYSRATLYNTMVTIGPDGALLNVHRKLVPTNPERMVWAHGDADGLRVVATPMGRVGGLVCWENYMPLARFALYAQGVQLYIAPAWDEGDTWIATMRHIAAEGRCWVLAAGCSLQARDIPDSFPERDRLYPDPDEWLNPGGSVIVEPGGRVVAGPLREQHGILYADCDPATADRAHRTLDAAGHYSRPDVFALTVRRERPRHVIFEEADRAEED